MKYIKIREIKKGFTMIELLVVISIIGILAALALVSFSSSQKQARDAQRKSDLRQYATSLEGYANKNNSLYPARPDSSGVDAQEILCDDLSLDNCPGDPKDDSANGYYYRYQSNGSSSTGAATSVKYVLWAQLENTENYWVVCSTGTSGAKEQSGFSVEGGVCPI